MFHWIWSLWFYCEGPIDTDHFLLSNSKGDLYPFISLLNKQASCHSDLVTITPSIWNQRLGHTNNNILKSLISFKSFVYNKYKLLSCSNACQLRKHLKLPFHNQLLSLQNYFQNYLEKSIQIFGHPLSKATTVSIIMLCFLMTKYIFSKFIHFVANAKYSQNFFISQPMSKLNSIPLLNIFNVTMDENIPIDFPRLLLHKKHPPSFFMFIYFPMKQKSEWMIRTINNMIHFLVFHAHLPTTFWDTTSLCMLIFSTSFHCQLLMIKHHSKLYLENLQPMTTWRYFVAFLPKYQQFHHTQTFTWFHPLSFPWVSTPT